MSCCSCRYFYFIFLCLSVLINFRKENLLCLPPSLPICLYALFFFPLDLSTSPVRFNPVSHAGYMCLAHCVWLRLARIPPERPYGFGYINKHTLGQRSLCVLKEYTFLPSESSVNSSAARNLHLVTVQCQSDKRSSTKSNCIYSTWAAFGFRAHLRAPYSF